MVKCRCGPVALPVPQLQVMPTFLAIHNPKDAIRNYEARNYGNYMHLARQEWGGSL